MDINHWKLVLFDWIKVSELIDVFGSLEHTQLDDYFFKFYSKIHSESNDNIEEIHICDFLKETYPDFETLYDETNNISSQDFVYVFSLLLHYSCVREKNEYFQIACTKLNTKFQMCIATFLEYIETQRTFNKETIRTGIKQAAIISPSQTKYFTVNSPLRTPKKSDISPPTPSKDFIFARLKELKAVKSQLENERYERNMLEMEVKQSQDKVNNLVKKCKDLSHEVQSLKANSIIDNDSENLSPNKSQREYQIRRKMQKEIQTREDLIVDLKYEVENANTVNKKYQEKINRMEKQMNEMRLKMRELDASLDELVCNMTMKDQKISILEEERKELLEFINETRSGVNSKDISSDCLDFSCSTALYTTTSDLCESLAKSVVEVQLKEKENEITKLNELLTSSNKVKEEMELKISELNETLKNLENEMNEIKTSKNKIFEEKSTEIQSLQNQLNNILSKNKELSRDLELKQKINLKMLEESDSYKNDAESLQKEVTELKEQIDKSKEKYEIVANELKVAMENQTYQNDNINSKLNEKDDKLLKLTKMAEELKKMNETLINESEAKLNLKTSEISSLNNKFAELEENYLREKIFNDELSKNNDILSAKLKKSRKNNMELKRDYEAKIEKINNEKRQYHITMETKLEEYKSTMISKFRALTESNEGKVVKLEKEVNIKASNINKMQDEILSYKVDVEEKDRTIKNLATELEQEKRDKKFLNSKLRFLEGSRIEDCDMLQAISSTPFVMRERFDNLHLEDLENGAGFDELNSIGSSSIFQERNSKYPPHLRDSYAIGSIDKILSERDMKMGTVKSSNYEPVSPVSENQRKKKDHTIYRRPGPPTPSKNARSSISSNHKIILKDSTNTENGEKKSTPARIKSFLSNFTKHKDELRGNRVDKNNRTLTPRRSKNQKEKWIVEKDTDSDENLAKCSRKEKELDRKEKRAKARDLNRPNLQDDHDDDDDRLTVCSNDSEWTDKEEEQSIEDEENDYEKDSNTTKQQDKSLEYIKNREKFRKRQQKMRRRSFNNNRLSSITKDHKIPERITRMPSDDWDKYKSCRSLQSDSCLALNSTLQSPTISCTRNFIETHFAEYNRMSDYRVPPKLQLVKVVDDGFWNSNLKDVNKPFPLIVIILLTLCLVSILVYNSNRN